MYELQMDLFNVKYCWPIKQNTVRCDCVLCKTLSERKRSHCKLNNNKKKNQNLYFMYITTVCIVQPTTTTATTIEFNSSVW